MAALSPGRGPQLAGGLAFPDAPGHFLVMHPAAGHLTAVGQGQHIPEQVFHMQQVHHIAFVGAGKAEGFQLLGDLADPAAEL